MIHEIHEKHEKMQEKCDEHQVLCLNMFVFFVG